jgi:PHP family Zn ribbon phosphoesterase
MNWPESIQEAVRRAGGARFYRCAFQVNPFEYFERHGQVPPAADEPSYNEAIVQACLAEGIEVIAVTDHYRVKTAAALTKAARDAGVVVFPAFEAVTKDGVHMLCLFEQAKRVDELERVLGDCGIHDQSVPSPVGKYTAEELLAVAENWGAVCIAAHVAGKSGLLKALSGPARMAAWRSSNLRACSIPGPVSSAPQGIRQILENKNEQYRRAQPVAVVNASDVGNATDLAKAGASCWVKMSEVSIEGLRQAFLDPGSRIRLASDPVPDAHSEFVAMTWEGGFLDGAAIRFNEGLNVLIGGRGTGKSTIVESLRYVLDLEPLGEESGKVHAGIVRNVLRDGTKVSLLVRSHHPSPAEYLVQRTAPNPPVVRTSDGEVSDLRPTDIVPGVEVYGQHEISELTRSPEKLTRLLSRFVTVDPASASRKVELRSGLRRARSRMTEIRTELAAIAEKLDALPGLEEKLARFEEAGIEEQLHDMSVLVTEEQVLKTATARLEPFALVASDLRRRLPVDLSFLSAEALRDLPASETLANLAPVLGQLSADIEAAATAIEEGVQRARDAINVVATVWGQRRDEVQAVYETTLRQLQATRNCVPSQSARSSCRARNKSWLANVATSSLCGRTPRPRSSGASIEQQRM